MLCDKSQKLPSVHMIHILIHILLYAHSNMDLLVTEKAILCFVTGHVHHGLPSLHIHLENTILMYSIQQMVHIQKRDNSACVHIVYAHCLQPLADPTSHLTMS